MSCSEPLPFFLRSYGRHIQRLIQQAVGCAEPERRVAYATALVALMQVMTMDKRGRPKRSKRQVAYDLFVASDYILNVGGLEALEAQSLAEEVPKALPTIQGDIAKCCGRYLTMLIRCSLSRTDVESPQYQEVVLALVDRVRQSHPRSDLRFCMRHIEQVAGQQIASSYEALAQRYDKEGQRERMNGDG